MKPGELVRVDLDPENYYWARPQSLAGYWHCVVADIMDVHGCYEQVTACGRRIVQSEEWMGLGSREYLRENACPRCQAKQPITAETVDGYDSPVSTEELDRKLSAQ